MIAPIILLDVIHTTLAGTLLRQLIDSPPTRLLLLALLALLGA